MFRFWGGCSWRGKCRHCRGRISPRYAIVELTVGLLFAAVYLSLIGLATGDLWERVGAWRVLAALVAAWAVISLVVVAALLGSDTRAGFKAPTAGFEHRRAGGGIDPV